LTGELKGYRSLRAAGQRYRIVYEVREHAPTVTVVVLRVLAGSAFARRVTSATSTGRRSEGYATAEPADSAS